MLQVTLHPDPFGGLNALVAVGAGALALFAAWTLVSATWSDAPGRALLEFSRALAYLLAFLLFASPPRTPGRVAWVLRGVALGILVVVGIGLLTRILPDVWPIRPGYADDRLSYPLTYWNAFGILSAIGAVLAFHLTASEREPAWVRLAGAAAVPVLATALYFSFSRGAFGAAVAGLVVYALAARPRALPVALVTVGIPTFFAVRAGFDAEVLSSEAFAGPAGVDEGRDVAVVLGIAVAAAVGLRALGLLADARLARIAVPPLDGRARWAVIGGGVVVVLAVAVAAGLPGYVDRQYERFKEPLPVGLENRDRFFVPSNNERLSIWRVARDGFEAEPLHGTGAGTFRLWWERERPEGIYTVTDGHSLYLEVLGELGLVGAVLLAVVLLTLLGGIAWRTRGPDRHVHAAVLAALVAWLLHAGVDWDWEMPAVSLWAFALGGATLAAAGGGKLAAGRLLRVAVALGCLVLAVTPVLTMRSQARLDDAVRAFEAGDCRTAIDAALGSIEAINARSEPFQVLGYCNARLGADDLAVDAMEQAVQRDPASWQTHYGLAIVRGAAGEDPRPEAERALELNPGSALAREAVERFRAVDDPAAWERRARRARLPDL